MQRFVKPIVVVSKCLGLGTCRYDGERLSNSFVKLLKRRVKFLPICPEIEVGLGMPRAPIAIVKSGTRKLLYQLPDGSLTQVCSLVRGRRLTRVMNDFSNKFVESLQEVDGFVLKSKSPSCGIRDTALLSDTNSMARVVEYDSGLFAETVLRRFPELPAEDERRLADTDIREHWLTKLFTLATFRIIKKRPSIAKLTAFHREYQLLLSTHNQTATRTMDRIVGQEACPPDIIHSRSSARQTSPSAETRAGGARGRTPPTERGDSSLNLPALIRKYEQQLHRALRRKPSRPLVVRALQIASDHYVPHLDRQEKIASRQLLEGYRESSISLHEIRKIILVWGVRYDKSFIKAHSFFRPYPEELGCVL